MMRMMGMTRLIRMMKMNMWDEGLFEDDEGQGR